MKYNNFQQYNDEIAQQIQARVTPNATIPKYDIDNMWDANGNITANGKTTTLMDAAPLERWLYEHESVYKNYKNVTKEGIVKSGSGGGGANNGSDLWQVKYVNDIFGDSVTGQYNVGVAGKTTKTIEPKSGYTKVATDVDNSTFYPTPSTFYDTGSDGTTKKMVVGIIKAPDGSYYKAHEDEVTIDENNPSGYTYTLSDIVNPKNKITNYWLQVIKPNTGTQKQLDDAAADLWATQPEKAKQWGVPKPIGMNESTAPTNTGTKPKEDFRKKYNY
jgi:hypothetical protein